MVQQLIRSKIYTDRLCVLTFVALLSRSLYGRMVTCQYRPSVRTKVVRQVVVLRTQCFGAEGGSVAFVSRV